jgi:3-deoxy-manno-octulosonate cytidylyltransferase (CMP-KDO synthetase)
MTFKVVIPARYESSRFPGKLLAKLGDKPVVCYAVEAARLSGAEKIIVATDDQRIADAVIKTGCEVLMTDKTHENGTERLVEVCSRADWQEETVVVNLQADEPFVSPNLIATIAQSLEENRSASVATACFPIHSQNEIFDPNLVKVVLDHERNALYFSRAPIPWIRDTYPKGTDSNKEVALGHGHIGIYGYRVSFLNKYAELPISPLEQNEKLEQLRVLQSGERILVIQTDAPPAPGIDTPEDLERAQEHISGL